MALDLSLLSAVYQTATLEARIQRILSITAAYYGLVPANCASRQVGGSQV